MIVNIIWYLKRIYRKITGSGSKDTWQFRDYLYKELIDLYGKEYFNNKRILEIGPRDGEDSKRLEELNPSEFILIDLPDKEAINNEWLGDLKSNHKFIQANFLYMSKED